MLVRSGGHAFGSRGFPAPCNTCQSRIESIEKIEDDLTGFVGERSASWILIFCASERGTTNTPVIVLVSEIPVHPLASEPLGLARYRFVGLLFQLSELVSDKSVSISLFVYLINFRVLLNLVFSPTHSRTGIH